MDTNVDIGGSDLRFEFVAIIDKALAPYSLFDFQDLQWDKKQVSFAFLAP